MSERTIAIGLSMLGGFLVAVATPWGGWRDIALIVGVGCIAFGSWWDAR